MESLLDVIYKTSGWIANKKCSVVKMKWKPACVQIKLAHQK